MTTAYTCSQCCDPVNWCESFNKFGHGDGDDCVHTTIVANMLKRAGYYVKHTDSSMHNPLITEIGSENIPGELAQFYAQGIPAGTRVGYSDPREALPVPVVALLDRFFGEGEFFG